MFENQKNSKKQGDVGLGQTISWACRMGYTVCLPLTDSQDYDLIVDAEEKIYRVQVKTTKCKAPSGFYVADLRVNGGNRSGTGKSKKLDPSRVDALFIVCDDGAEYFVPVWASMPCSMITMNEDFAKHRV